MILTAAFFRDIRRLIVDARTTVVRGVDLVQVHTNFEIGRRVVKEEQRGKDRAALQNPYRIGQTLTGQLAIFQSLTVKSVRPFTSSLSNYLLARQKRGTL